MQFIVIGDSKGKDRGINERVLSKILKESKKLLSEPEFIVLCGDNVAGSINESNLAEQLQRLRDIIIEYYPKIALVPVIGNHEVNNDPKDNTYEKIFEMIYRDALPDTCLDGFNNTVYYIDYKDTRFIILNSFHAGEINKIGENQLSWLYKVGSVPIRNKILFVHSPAFPTGAHLGHCLDLYPKDRDAFWSIVEKCNIDIVFSGHEHNYSRRRIESKRVVYQIITGGGGEKLRDKYRDKSGIIIPPIAKYHFIVGDIDGSGIRISALCLDGSILDDFKINK